MMDLQIVKRPAELASPVVTHQDLLVKMAVSLWVEPDSVIFGTDLRHEAFPLISDRNSCLCALGRNR